MAKVQEQRKDNEVCDPSKSHKIYFQAPLPRLAGKMSDDHYGMKVATLVAAADRLTAQLDYLCALTQCPDPEWSLPDAVSYAYALVCLESQLEFLVEDLADNDLSEDELYVRLSKEEVYSLNRYTENSEEALRRLEERCGISLRNN